jgi:rsbT antagonist protein RsbS
MQIPILKQGNNLVVSIQSALSDADLLQLQRDLVEMAGKARVRGVVIDVTALDVIDSFACRTLRDLSYALKLRGAQAVIVGIQPEVAFAMVQLGLSLEGVVTKRDLEEGMAFLSLKIKKGGKSA